MPIVYQKFISREDIQNNRDVLFVFGDNCTGYSGQAKEMRGEPNSVGVRTKLKAAHGAGCYFTDEQYDYFVALIDEDFVPIREHLKKGGKVVIPADGLGTGLAKLSEYAPKILAYLEQQIKELEDV